MNPIRARRRFRSLQTRLMLGTVLVILVVMVALIALVEHRQRLSIIEEVKRRGTVLAENLASIATPALVLYNFTALEQHVTRLAAEADVAYAMVLDAEGRVAAHSRWPDRVGALLADPVTAQARAAGHPLVQELRPSGGEAFYDFAAPIFVERERWGTVRLGLSRQRMEALIAKTRLELALLAGAILVAGAAAAAVVARRVARPVRELADAVAALSRGDFGHRIERLTSDEIGALTVAFNEMVDRLGRQREDLQAAHGELARRFAELSDLKRYTDSVLGSLTSGVVTLDLEGRVVTLNPAAEALIGCSAREERGRPIALAFTERPELVALLDRVLSGQVLGGPVALALTRPGEPGAPAIPVEVVTAPLRDAEGRVDGLVAALRDLTAVRQLEEQLRRSDRLAALGTLAAGLAHEIKNPLTSILTFSRHLTRRFGDERFRQRFQSVVPRELERINGIVDGLLRLARPLRLVLSPAHVSPLVDQALELYANQTEARQVTVVRDYAVGLPPVTADAEHLYQALVNLVQNALDAMPEGGTLTARIAPGPAAGLAGGGDGRTLAIEIEDTGSGISSVEAPNVFNPFFTTKPSGTGLGLALAHKIVEDHGGAITFRSLRGRGTTFVIVLPLGGPARHEASAPPVRPGALVRPVDRAESR